MRNAITAAVAGVLLLTGAAAAQTSAPQATAAAAAPEKPDPVRLELARQVLDASGGVEATQARMRVMFSTVSDMVKSNLPADQSALSDALFKYMADEEIKAIPSLLDQAATIYASHLTETELRDMLAWNASASARSIHAKMPQITQELMLSQAPLIKKMMAGVAQTAIDRACEEQHCTAEQRKRVTAMIQKALPPTS